MLRRLVTLSTIALTWLLGACDDNGPCDHDPALCMLHGLTIDPATMARSQLGAKATSTLTVTTSKAWLEFRQKLRGTLVPKDAGTDRIQLDELTSPPSEYRPSLFAVRDQLTPGTYTFKIAHPARDLELADGQPDPTLTITDGPVALAWEKHSSSPLTFPLASVSAVTVRGVWVGRPSTSGGTSLAEVLLLRNFKDNVSKDKATVSAMNSPTPSWLSPAAVYDSASTSLTLFDLWHFSTPRAVYVPPGNPGYKIFDAPINAASAPTAVNWPQLSPTAMAIAVRKDTSSTEQVGLLVQTSSGLKGYVSSSNYMTLQDVTSSSSCTPKYLVGYADDPEGKNGVGVLGMAAQGKLCFFDFDGTKFSFNKAKSDSLNSFQMVPTKAVTALAVGDVNGDGRNDIAIAQANKIEFYVNQWWGFVPAKESLALSVEPAAIAIGQMDGLGKNDLLVADVGKPNCGTDMEPPCEGNHVYVYLNKTN